MWTAIARWSLLAASIALVSGAIFSFGSSYKDAQWQAKWTQEKLAQANEINRLKTEYGAKEDEHRKKNSELEARIGDQKKVHEVAIAAVLAEYGERLRKSETRANVYQRQAQSGPVGCQRLADHAAELDRSIEQGRSLVQELRLTLGQRDEHVRALSEQIINDRKLFE